MKVCLDNILVNFLGADSSCTKKMHQKAFGKHVIELYRQSISNWKSADCDRICCLPVKTIATVSGNQLNTQILRFIWEWWFGSRTTHNAYALTAKLTDC